MIYKNQVIASQHPSPPTYLPSCPTLKNTYRDTYLETSPPNLPPCNHNNNMEVQSDATRAALGPAAFLDRVFILGPPRDASCSQPRGGSPGATWDCECWCNEESFESLERLNGWRCMLSPPEARSPGLTTVPGAPTHHDDAVETMMFFSK